MIGRLAGSRFRPVAWVLLGVAVLAGVGVSHLRGTTATARTTVSAVPVAVLPANAAGIPKTGSGYFTVTAAPGQTVDLHALLLNRTRRRQTLTLAPVDAYENHEGLSYGLPGNARRGVGAWLHLWQATLRLAPSGPHLLGMRLRIPAQIPAGTYAGALSIGWPTSSTSARGAASIRVQMRLAVAVVVQVRGTHRA